ncbi:MAG: methyltransferase [Myxococcales bacterium]|nr:methyltransferase [Myxococcales bacterium]
MERAASLEVGELTCDSILRGRLRLWQPVVGYRFSIDPLLLIDFVSDGSFGQVADLGAGVGIVGLGLARRFEQARVTLVELQPRLAELSRRNIVENELTARCQVVLADVLSPSTKQVLPGGSFELVASCPPYYPVGHGGVNPDSEEAIARHELRLPLPKLVAAAKRLVGFRGRVAFVYPSPRLPELLTALGEHSLPVRRLRLVHPQAGEPAQRVMVEAQKGYRGGLVIEPPLYIREADGRYTVQARRALGEPD